MAVCRARQPDISRARQPKQLAGALTPSQRRSLEPARRSGADALAQCAPRLTRSFAMLNIQVGHSYFLSYDRKQWERGKPYPPLATIQVAALLREMGHAASLFDAMLADGVEDNFNYLTKMCLGRMREAACQMIAEARAHGARVIVAGSDASDHPDAFLAA